VNSDRQTAHKYLRFGFVLDLFRISCCGFRMLLPQDHVVASLSVVTVMLPPGLPSFGDKRTWYVNMRWSPL
jgi:hypothetical protein